MLFKAYLKDNCGATAVEYGLIASLFVLGTTFGLDEVSVSVQDMLDVVSAAIDSILDN